MLNAMKRLLLIVATVTLVALTMPSCLVFKCYNGRAQYKDPQREIIIASDTLVGVGNKAVNVLKVSTLAPPQ